MPQRNIPVKNIFKLGEGLDSIAIRSIVAVRRQVDQRTW